jgi:hypothetical protein
MSSPSCASGCGHHHAEHNSNKNNHHSKRFSDVKKLACCSGPWGCCALDELAAISGDIFPSLNQNILNTLNGSVGAISILSGVKNIRHAYKALAHINHDLKALPSQSKTIDIQAKRKLLEKGKSIQSFNIYGAPGIFAITHGACIVLGLVLPQLSAYGHIAHSAYALVYGARYIFWDASWSGAKGIPIEHAQFKALAHAHRQKIQNIGIVFWICAAASGIHMFFEHTGGPLCLVSGVVLLLGSGFVGIYNNMDLQQCLLNPDLAVIDTLLKNKTKEECLDALDELKRMKDTIGLYIEQTESQQQWQMPWYPYIRGNLLGLGWSLGTMIDAFELIQPRHQGWCWYGDFKTEQPKPEALNALSSCLHNLSSDETSWQKLLGDRLVVSEGQGQPSANVSDVGSFNHGDIFLPDFLKHSSSSVELSPKILWDLHIYLKNDYLNKIKDAERALMDYYIAYHEIESSNVFST